jgi:hypothetical protein
VTAKIPAFVKRSMRLGRWVTVLGFVVATSFLLVSLNTATTIAQSGTINIRPTIHDPASTIGGPLNAYDTSDASSAGSAVSHACRTQCTTITTKTGTWSGIPEGYRPRRLEVHWQGAPHVALFGADTSRIEVNSNTV